MGRREKVRARQLKKREAAKTSKLVKARHATITKVVRTQQTIVEKGVLKHAKDSKCHMLIVGDGDFSFAASVAQLRGGDANLITATSFDSHSQVISKYGTRAERNLKAVTDGKGTTRHRVDATKLHLRTAWTGSTFDIAVFNFPHTGQQRAHLNRALVVDFLKSGAVVAHTLAVTIKMAPPYDRWKIEDLAVEAGVQQIRSDEFDMRQFPGYQHATTDPTAKKLDTGPAHKSGRVRCRTFFFVRPKGDESV